MALTLIKEDGTGKAEVNAYASTADGDAYHEGHLYADSWQAATTERKEAALVMATRVIDAEYQFSGTKASDAQALQWPREGCLDPDADGWAGGTVASSVVPKAVVDATPWSRPGPARSSVRVTGAFPCAAPWRLCLSLRPPQG